MRGPVVRSALVSALATPGLPVDDLILVLMPVTEALLDRLGAAMRMAADV
jgi:hypothetical protein